MCDVISCCLNGAEGEVGSVVHSAGLCVYYPWSSFRRQECIAISCWDLLSPRSDRISTWQCCRAGRSGTSPCWEETPKQNSSITENYEVRGQQLPERCFKWDLQFFRSSVSPSVISSFSLQLHIFIRNILRKFFPKFTSLCVLRCKTWQLRKDDTRLFLCFYFYLFNVHFLSVCFMLFAICVIFVL